MLAMPILSGLKDIQRCRHRQHKLLALTTLLARCNFPLVRTRKSYHHGALRKALIDEAFQVLEREGLEGVSLRALASSAGVSKTAPYRHFADKRELLATLAAEGFRMLADSLEEVLSGTDDPSPKETDGTSRAGNGGGEDRRGRDAEAAAGVHRLFRAYLRFAQSRPALYRLMFSPLGFSLHSESCRINSARALACLVRAVEEARAHGWHASQETTALVLSLWAEVHGWAGLLIDRLLPAEIDLDADSIRHLSETLLE